MLSGLEAVVHPLLFLLRLLIFQQTKRGAHYFALVVVSAGINLGADELLKVGIEGKARWHDVSPCFAGSDLDGVCSCLVNILKVLLHQPLQLINPLQRFLRTHLIRLQIA